MVQSEFQSAELRSRKAATRVLTCAVGQVRVQRGNVLREFHGGFQMALFAHRTTEASLTATKITKGAQMERWTIDNSGVLLFVS